MTATQEPLFAPGWEQQEPRARRQVSRARRTGLAWDYGRSAARHDIVHGRRIHTITVPGRWL